MLNWIVSNRTVWWLIVRSYKICKIELWEIELFDYLIVCKQMTDVNLIVSDTSYLPTPPLGQDMTQGQF